MADLTLRAVVEGTDQAQQQFKALSTSIKDVGMSEEERARIEERLQRAAREIHQQNEERIKSTQALRTHTAELVRKFQEQEAANESLSRGHGKLAGNTAFLTREFRALFDELASGRSRMAIGTGTLLITRLTGIGLAGVGAIAAIAGLTAGLGYMIYKAEESDRAIAGVESRLRATGQAGFLASKQIGDMIESLASRPGMDFESSSKAVQAIANMHDLSAPLLRDLTELTADMASALGVQAPAAAKALADAFADPEKGAKKLDEQLNFLTADQRLQIQSLVELGHKSEAQQVLLDALKTRVTGLADQGFTPLQRATKEFGNSLHETFGEGSTPGQKARDWLAAMISGTAHLIRAIPQTAEGLGKLASAVVEHIAPTPPAIMPMAANQGDIRAFEVGAPARARLADEQAIKNALEAGRAYDSYGTELRKAIAARDDLTAALEKANKLGETSAADQLVTDIKGANEKIEEMQRAHYKKMQAPQEEAYKQGMGYIQEQLRQEGAALKEGDQEQESYARMQKDRTSTLLRQESADLREKLSTDAKAQREYAQLQIAEIRNTVYWTRDAKIKALEDARDVAIKTYGEEGEAVKKLNAEIARQPTEQQENAKQIRQIFGKLTFDTISVFGQIHTALSSQISGVLRGTQSLGQGVKGIFRGVVDAVFDELARLASNKILMWLMGIDTSTGGSSGISLLGSIAGGGQQGGGGGAGIAGLLGADSINAGFQSLGVSTGSQFLADIGNYGYGVPVVGGLLTAAATGDVGKGAAVAAGSLIGNAILPGIGGVVGGFLGGLFQTGTDTIVTKPTLFMAGEAGAERLRVDPLHGSAGLSSGGGAGVAVHVHGLSMMDNYSARRLAYAVRDMNK